MTLVSSSSSTGDLRPAYCHSIFQQLHHCHHHHRNHLNHHHLNNLNHHHHHNHDLFKIYIVLFHFNSGAGYLVVVLALSLCVSGIGDYKTNVYRQNCLSPIQRFLKFINDQLSLMQLMQDRQK